MKMSVLFIALTIALVGATSAQTKLTTNTLKIPKTYKNETRSIDVMKWLEGSWSGTGLGGDVKEMWQSTGSGEMIGMFVYSKDGKTVFYEFLTLSVDDQGLAIKLKHFNPDMVGWEEKDKFVTFRFIRKQGSRYYFGGLTFEAISKNKAKIYLALRQNDGSLKEEAFEITNDRPRN